MQYTQLGKTGLTVFCLDRGVGVIPFSPLARGILARAELPADATSCKTVRWCSARSTPVAKARGESLATVAMEWLLRSPGVTAPSAGITRLDHLQTAIDSLATRLSVDEVNALESPYRPHAVRGH